MPAFDGTEFQGPMDIDRLPGLPGVYLIVTDASGGVKILGAYEAEDAKASAASNPRRECWQKNRKDSDPVAYFREDRDLGKRQELVFGIHQRRFYGLVCSELPKDDF